MSKSQEFLVCIAGAGGTLCAGRLLRARGR